MSLAWTLFWTNFTKLTYKYFHTGCQILALPQDWEQCVDGHPNPVNIAADTKCPMDESESFV